MVDYIIEENGKYFKKVEVDVEALLAQWLQIKESLEVQLAEAIAQIDSLSAK